MIKHRSIQVQGKPLGGGQLPIIITPLVGPSRATILQEVALIAPKRPDLLEWRVDFFEGVGNTPKVIDTARAIRAASGGLPLLLTRRRRAEGGQAIALDEPAVVEMYSEACKARCVELIDYELSNPLKLLQQLRAVSADSGVAMIMSFHDFERTPDATTLDAKFADAARLGADVAKAAVMPQSPQDVLDLLAATYRASQALDIALITLSMGSLGSLSRIMGWVYGSAATFAVGKGSSAPGQIAIEELRKALMVVRRAVNGE